jgi:hypothetical protein
VNFFKRLFSSSNLALQINEFEILFRILKDPKIKIQLKYYGY